MGIDRHIPLSLVSHQPSFYLITNLRSWIWASSIPSHTFLGLAVGGVFREGGGGAFLGKKHQEPKIVGLGEIPNPLSLQKRRPDVLPGCHPNVYRYLPLYRPQYLSRTLLFSQPKFWELTYQNCPNSPSSETKESRLYGGWMDLPRLC